MKIQKINEFYKKESTIINEGLYKTPTYKEKVFSSLIHLIMDDRGISEKSFDEVDRLIDNLREYFKEDKVNKVINEFEENGRRENYCAEFIYDTMIKNKK